MAVPGSLAVSKAVNANGGAARGPARAALKIYAAKAVRNAPPVPSLSVEPAVARGTKEQPRKRQTSSTTLPPRVMNSPTSQRQKKTIMTANAVFAAKNVATASREEDALAPKTLAAATLQAPYA